MEIIFLTAARWKTSFAGWWILRHARKIVLYTCICTTCICTTTTTTTISSRICSDDGALTLTLMQHPDRPDRSWRYAYLRIIGFFSIRSVESDTAQDDGIEDAVVKNALRGPPAAGCPLSHSQQW